MEKVKLLHGSVHRVNESLDFEGSFLPVLTELNIASGCGVVL